MVNLLKMRTKAYFFIVLFGICIIAFTWISGFKYLAYEKKLTIDAVHQSNSSQTKIMEHHIQFVLKEIDNILLIIKHQYETSGEISSESRSIIHRFSTRGTIEQVDIADQHGQITLSERPGATVNIAEEDRFQTLKEKDSNHLYIEKPRTGFIPGQSLIYLSRRLNDRNGNFAGIVSVAVRPESLTDILVGQNQRPSEDTIVIGLDGIVRAATSLRYVQPGTDRSRNPVFEAVKHAPVGDVLSVGPSGQLRYRSYRLMSAYPLIISAGTDEEDALAGYYDREREYIVVSCFLSLIVAGFCFYLIRTIKYRIRAEELAQDAKNRYRALVDDIQDVVVHTDLSGKILLANRAMATLFGFQSPSELIGRPITLFWQDPLKRKELLQGLQARDQVSDFFVTARDACGNQYDFSANINKSEDSRGNITGLVLVGRNISEQRKMDREKQELQAKTAALERISSMGIMVAGVAHELSQPLQAGQLAIESVLYWQEQGKEMPRAYQLDSMHRIADAFKRIGRIVRHLRDFIQSPGNGIEEATTLNQAVLMALDLMQVRLKAHRITVRLGLQAEFPFNEPTFARLDEAVINVLNNALQALDAVSDRERVIWIATRTETRYIILDIENNGPPIESNQAEKLFEPFFTTKARTEGMGLGLHIVRNITEAAGGQVNIGNSARGVLVTFRFPMQNKGV